jgi:Ribbon-helix-helix protein, copG family
LFHFREPIWLARLPGLRYYAETVSAKRVVIYMPDDLVDALNRVTAGSPQSRSEIICAAVERYLADTGQSLATDFGTPDEAFFDRVAEMMQSGLLQPGDFTDSASEEPRPKSKLWIN